MSEQAGGKCRGCGKQLEKHAAVSGARIEPQPGDLSICFGCGTLARYGAGLELVPVELDQVAELDAMDRARIRRLQDMCRVRRAS